MVWVEHNPPSISRLYVIDGIASPGGEGQALAVGEDYGVFLEEGAGAVVGCHVGLDEDEDAVAGLDLDVACYERGVAVDIETEAAGAPFLEGHGAEAQVVRRAVVDGEHARGGAVGGEDGVEREGILRESQDDARVVDFEAFGGAREERAEGEGCQYGYQAFTHGGGEYYLV